MGTPEPGFVSFARYFRWGGPIHRGTPLAREGDKPWRALFSLRESAGVNPCRRLGTSLVEGRRQVESYQCTRVARRIRPETLKRFSSHAVGNSVPCRPHARKAGPAALQEPLDAVAAFRNAPFPKPENDTCVIVGCFAVVRARHYSPSSSRLATVCRT